jgi:hypothetical protein
LAACRLSGDGESKEPSHQLPHSLLSAPLPTPLHTPLPAAPPLPATPPALLLLSPLPHSLPHSLPHLPHHNPQQAQQHAWCSCEARVSGSVGSSSLPAVACSAPNAPNALPTTTIGAVGRAGHLLAWVAPICVFRRENSGFGVWGTCQHHLEQFNCGFASNFQLAKCRAISQAPGLPGGPKQIGLLPLGGTGQCLKKTQGKRKKKSWQHSPKPLKQKPKGAGLLGRCGGARTQVPVLVVFVGGFYLQLAWLPRVSGHQQPGAPGCRCRTMNYNRHQLAAAPPQQISPPPSVRAGAAGKPHGWPFNSCSTKSN